MPRGLTPTQVFIIPSEGSPKRPTSLAPQPDDYPPETPVSKQSLGTFYSLPLLPVLTPSHPLTRRPSEDFASHSISSNPRIANLIPAQRELEEIRRPVVFTRQPLVKGRWQQKQKGKQRTYSFDCTDTAGKRIASGTPCSAAASAAGEKSALLVLVAALDCGWR